MKLLITCALALFSSYTLACSCAEYPLSHDPAIRDYVQNKYDHYAQLSDEDIQWVAYYPSIGERMFWGSVRGTSCEGQGPNGEIMAHCSNARKSDYLVQIARKNCQVVLRVKSTFTKISVKELSTTCKR